MWIPSKMTCQQLMQEMKMMHHIVAHSHQVCQVALLLVDQLSAVGNTFNRELVQASALLHDITKTRSFKTKENHAVTGARLLSGLGYTDVGIIVGQHVKLAQYVNSNSKRLSEAEIVNYADKRVLHDKIVSLQKRMNYITMKYGKEENRRRQIYRLWQKTEQLERRLFKRLPFSPSEVRDLLSQPTPFSE